MCVCVYVYTPTFQSVDGENNGTNITPRTYVYKCAETYEERKNETAGRIFIYNILNARRG